MCLLDQHIRLYETSNGRFTLFRDIVARDVGWSVVDTAYRRVLNFAKSFKSVSEIASGIIIHHYYYSYTNTTSAII